MILLQGLFAGLIATFFYDLYQISLKFSYNINKSRWDLIGRYFINLYKGKRFQEDIYNEKTENNELLIGYIIHYLIGSIFGIFFLCINYIYLSDNLISIGTFYIALIFGLSTVLGSWCFLMPFAFNMGFFASKNEDQYQILIQNLLAHFVFGVGLFIGFSLTNL